MDHETCRFFAILIASVLVTAPLAGWLVNALYDRWDAGGC